MSLQEGNKITIDHGDENKFQIVQFDTPELDMLLVKFLLYLNKDVHTNFFCIFFEKHVLCVISCLLFHCAGKCLVI